MSKASESPRSEYDEAFGDAGDEERNAAETAAVRSAFRNAAGPYLSAALPWFACAIDSGP